MWPHFSSLCLHLHMASLWQSDLPCMIFIRTTVIGFSAHLSNPELTMAQIMNTSLPNSDLKLKKVRKTTRLFRYDLNQIAYDYTVGVRNRFKGLDLIECLMNYGLRFMTLYRRQGSRPSPRKRNAKKQNGCLRRPYK